MSQPLPPSFSEEIFKAARGHLQNACGALRRVAYRAGLSDVEAANLLRSERQELVDDLRQLIELTELAPVFFGRQLIVTTLVDTIGTPEECRSALKEVEWALTRFDAVTMAASMPSWRDPRLAKQCEVARGLISYLEGFFPGPVVELIGLRSWLLLRGWRLALWRQIRGQRPAYRSPQPTLHGSLLD